jgi:toxin ParE1/3/4
VNIRWTDWAADQLNSSFEYIAFDNEEAAVHFAQRIHEAINLIAKMPYIGRAGQEPDTREFVVAGSSYIIVYRIREEAVEILSVWHGAQNR